MTIIFLIYLIVFILGLAIGSFLNCIIYRLEKNEELTGRSYCPYCKHTLGWFDLFPVLSFLWLKGRCRYCHKKISIQYPIVEVSTGLLFLLILKQNIQTFDLNNWHGTYFQISAVIFNFINLLFLFYILSILIIIFFYDLKHYIIPDKVLFPAIIISFIYRFSNSFQIQFYEKFIDLANFKFEFFTIGNYIFAAFFASGFFLLIYLISRGEWMGFGDVKLAILLGLILAWPNILLGIFLAFFFGAIIGIALMILDLPSLPMGLKSQIPFAPFLIAGTLVAIIWGQQIIDWYLHFLI